MATGTEEQTQKSAPSLTANLNDFLEHTANKSKREICRSRERIIRRALNPILHELAGFDDRFYAEPIDADGCYVAVTHTDEFCFDVVVTLPNILTPKTLTSKDQNRSANSFIDTCTCDNPYVDQLPGFGYVVTDPNITFCHDLLSDHDDIVSSVIHENFVSHGYLSPVKVLDLFGELVQKAVDKLEAECWWEREPTVYQVDVEKQGMV